MKKKILFFVDDYSGGAGNVVQILANEFYKHQNLEPVVALVNHHSKKYKLNRSIKTIENNLSSNKTKNILLWFWRNIKSIRNIVSEIQPDIIISFLDNINTNVCLSLFFNRSIPIFVSERNNTLTLKPEGKYRYLRPLAYRRANLISVQFEIFKDFLPRLKKKMFVTPNPVLQPSNIKNNYELSNPINFITCARLAPQKQLDKMIFLFDKINKKYPDSRLTIYGEGKERDSLAKLIKQLNLENNIKLAGAAKGIYKVLAESDIYLMTSKDEGFPNSVCEAMAVGVPVIGFECHKGLAEIIISNENGILVEPDNISQMLDGIDRLIQDSKLRKKLGENSKKITSKYSVENIAKMWIDLINYSK